MTDAVTKFFDAWGMADDAERKRVLASVYAKSGTYADPRSDDTLTGPAAIAEYVAMFSANAPGWVAEVAKSDVTGGIMRLTVRFRGADPAGAETRQYGQYFVRMDGDRICEMVGFVGIGEPE